MSGVILLALKRVCDYREPRPRFTASNGDVAGIGYVTNIWYSITVRPITTANGRSRIRKHYGVTVS